MSIRVIKVEYLEDGTIKEYHEMQDGSVRVIGFYNGREEFNYEVKLAKGGN